ncbi:MAG: cupin domain-containing protein [Verrucomicrobiota bacterium]|jgi:(S)-ureidoglycine aminohydrolase
MNPLKQRLSPDHATSKRKFLSLFLLALCSASALMAQTPIRSDVYAWKDSPVEKTKTGSKRSIIKGMATDFQYMDISATTLKKKKTENEGVYTDFEELVIVKDGRLKITIGGESKTVGRGSVAVIMPGDQHSFENAADGETTYYVFRYRSKNPVDLERGKKSGGSFVMDWNDVKFNSRSDGKGGMRNFFTRATAMGRRLELHATFLEPRQSSHAPHHHRAEELVVILHANTEMYLGPEEKGGRTKKATDGDIIYLVSNEYHAISNLSDESALYIAFQFE